VSTEESGGGRARDGARATGASTPEGDCNHRLSSGAGPLDCAAIWRALDTVMDPEIPDVSIVDLGIVQQVDIGDSSIRVAITPTFSGCPALEVMRSDIRDRLLEIAPSGSGLEIDVPVLLDPPWTSDRIKPKARARMAEIGIAPPPPSIGRFRQDVSLSFAAEGNLSGLGTHSDAEPPSECPFCGSEDTRLESPFGPTICRSLHYCNTCQQPFERFKSL